MKINAVGAFGIGFAFGFVLSFVFIGTLAALLGLATLGVFASIAVGVFYGAVSVGVFYVWRFFSRNQQIAIVVALFVIGFFFPAVDVVALAGLAFTALEVKKGR